MKLTPVQRSAKLLEAKQLVDEVVASFGKLRADKCSGCGLMRYTNWMHFEGSRSLNSISKKLSEWSARVRDEGDENRAHEGP